MRILFNHGLTIGELYSNTPQSITSRKWSWFIERYGSTSSYEDAISDPFKYAIGLIFNDILDNRNRFIVPGVPETYIDFEMVDGDKFTYQRQCGRFQNIDFIESDFTGYALRYYYKSKAYQKNYQIYLGGELKEKFLNGINSGIKYYTIKDTKLEDFLPKIYEKFSELSQYEVKKLILHGFRRMHSSLKYGCAVSLNTKKYFNCVAHIGAIYLEPSKQLKEYSIRRDKKLRKIEAWKRTPFDGYYYIGLNESAFEQFIEDNKTSRVLLYFRNIMVRKIKEEIYYKDKHLYIFRIKEEKFRGWLYLLKDVKLRNVEYIGESIDRKFSPSNITWKELIKKYEKGKC